jgi:hypothetical protein
MQIDKKLYEEINDFCKINDLKTRDFIHNLLQEAFMKEKYGTSPFDIFNKKENVEKEDVITTPLYKDETKFQNIIIDDIKTIDKDKDKDIDYNVNEIFEINNNLLSENNEDKIKTAKRRKLK